MATITKLSVDISSEKLLMLATTTGVTTADNVEYHHKFTNIYVDTTQTFNCSSGPSSNATQITLNLDFDTNLRSGVDDNGNDIPYEIPFSLIMSDDIPNELIFVWLEETEYYEQKYNGYISTSDNKCYLTDAENSYYVIDSLSEGYLMSASTATDYNAAAASADTDYTITTYVNSDTMYIECVDSSAEEDVTTYFTQDLTDLSTTLAASDEETYDADENRLIPDDETAPMYFGVTLSVSTLYGLILDKIAIQDTTCCNANCSDVNFMLAWNGFNLAKSLGEYKQMIYYWEALHQGGSSNSIGCGCN